MHILGLDPGGMTGWCFWESTSDTYHFDQIDTSAIDLRDDFSNRLVKAIRSFPDFTIICERFEFRHEERTRDKIDYTPGTVIGRVEEIFHANSMRGQRLVEQGASQAKGFWDDAKLRRVGLWKGMGAKHAMDALRHVLYYRTFTMGDQSMLLKLK